uniref:Uncharacterized protein n=1 Tax=Sinocyclocheilus rhinocerous TaxID=307959 RepID=A0A673GF89_9TELE
MVKGAALFLQQGSCPQGQRGHPHHKHAGESMLASFCMQNAHCYLSGPRSFIYCTSNVLLQF